MVIDRNECLKLLRENEEFLVLSHEHPDGDTLGSAFALCEILRIMGKKRAFMCSDEISSDFNFMTEGFTPDTVENPFIIAVDVADVKLLGKIGEQYGDNLRGIRDEQYFGLNTGSFISEKALSSWTALNLCFDFPISLFTTNFKKSILRHFNFEVQLAPFIDLSLGYNRYTKRLFDIKDGFYTAGVEILVYPLKWQSLTVRGCLGVDMGRFLNIVDTSWRADISLFEFSFGIGLHY